MLFFYIRHGDPIYEPDSLTKLGEKQADALAKRLALYGIDRVFASSSERAIMTARPTCDLVKKEMEIVDFANECYAAEDFIRRKDGKATWLFFDYEARTLFSDESVISLGHNWCDHSEFAVHKKGVDRVYNESFEFFKSLGYEHIGKTGRYKILQSNNDRVAFFAHQGFGLAFLSALLDIPYPMMSLRFDMGHSGMTVIEFRGDGFVVPKVLQLSNDSHIFASDLKTVYNGYIEF